MTKQLSGEGTADELSAKIRQRLETEIMDAQDRYPTESDVLRIAREEMPGLWLLPDGGALVAHEILEALKQINE